MTHIEDRAYVALLQVEVNQADLHCLDLLAHVHRKVGRQGCRTDTSFGADETDHTGPGHRRAVTAPLPTSQELAHLAGPLNGA